MGGADERQVSWQVTLHNIAGIRSEIRKHLQSLDIVIGQGGVRDHTPSAPFNDEASRWRATEKGFILPPAKSRHSLPASHMLKGGRNQDEVSHTRAPPQRQPRHTRTHAHTDRQASVPLSNKRSQLNPLLSQHCHQAVNKTGGDITTMTSLH